MITVTRRQLIFFCNFYVAIGLHDANSLIGGTFGMSSGLVKRVTDQKHVVFPSHAVW